MVNEDTPDTVKFAFFALHREWFDVIYKELNDEQKEKYNNVKLRAKVMSLSIRLSEMSALAEAINTEMAEIRKYVGERKAELESCMKEKMAFGFLDILHLYRLLAYTESLITLMKSAADFLFQYFRIFEKNILSKKKYQAKNALEEAGFDLRWKDDLDAIRNDLLHQYASWPSLLVQNGKLDFQLELSTSIMPREIGKKYRKEQISIKEVNQIYRSFADFYDRARAFLISQIKEVNIS